MQRTHCKKWENDKHVWSLVYLLIANKSPHQMGKKRSSLWNRRENSQLLNYSSIYRNEINTPLGEYTLFGVYSCLYESKRCTIQRFFSSHFNQQLPFVQTHIASLFRFFCLHKNNWRTNRKHDINMNTEKKGKRSQTPL